MKLKWGRIILFVMVCALLPLTSFAAEQAVAIKPQAEAVAIQVGKSGTIHLHITPSAARSRGVTYTSDNEAIATVNQHGKISGHEVGTCNITITSKYDPETSVVVAVSVIVPAKKMQFSADNATVKVGETITLEPVFEPADASLQQATYKSSQPRIATVDENGVVTGIKAGSATIKATAIDGGRAHANMTVHVIQPVLGVSYKTPHVRVGVNYHGTFTATLEPHNATDHHMTWTSENPDIATVSGTDNRVRIQGKEWGQTTITGVTEDGGYEVQFLADIGSLKHAIQIHRLTIHDGAPHITLKNGSNLNISEVRYQIRGYDAQGNPIQMSRDGNILYGSYEHTLAPGDESVHGEFHFDHHSNYAGLAYFEMAISGWTTDTGYYNSKGETLYRYSLSDAHLEWISSTNW